MSNTHSLTVVVMMVELLEEVLLLELLELELLELLGVVVHGVVLMLYDVLLLSLGVVV
jgi:hypothetical protein